MTESAKAINKLGDKKVSIAANVKTLSKKSPVSNLRSKKITVSIKQFIRDEIKSESLDLLKSQIQKDKVNCNSIIDIID